LDRVWKYRKAFEAEQITDCYASTRTLIFCLRAAEFGALTPAQIEAGAFLNQLPADVRGRVVARVGSV
jgi:hypothetical protein